MTDDDEARRQANYELYRRMRAAQNGGDKATWLDCFNDDVVFEAPYYRHDGPLASGRDRMSGMFDRMQEVFSSIHYEVKRFIPAVDPDLVIVEVKGDNAVANSDRRYQNDYLFLVTCHDGRISHIFEYSNPQVYAAAVNG
jgi:ketosteroid isomerase-like protein